MEDLQSQTSVSMDWLSKFTQSTFTPQTHAQFYLEWRSFFFNIWQGQKFFSSNLTLLLHKSLMSENGQNWAIDAV